MRIAAISAAAFLLAGCAKAPEDIPPSFVSDTSYTSWSCQNLTIEGQKLGAGMSSAYSKQRTAREGDTVGVILLGLPVASLTGDNVAPEVARLKGEYEAVRRAATAKNCPSIPQPII